MNINHLSKGQKKEEASNPDPSAWPSPPPNRGRFTIASVALTPHNRLCSPERPRLAPTEQLNLVRPLADTGSCAVQL